MASVTKSLTELQKSDKYQRALSLNLDCGSDTLRKLIDATLDSRNVTLKKHLQDVAVQTKLNQLKKRKVVYGEQLKQLNSKNPDLLCMDISLLTIVLLELISTTSCQDKNIRKLRQKRNELAHMSRAKLDDDIPFNEASQIIIDLSKDVSPEFENEIRLQIQELNRRELVCTRSNLDIVKLQNESLMVKLVECGEDGKVDEKSDIWIRYRLTKSVRLLSRLLDVDVFLQELFGEGVVDECTLKVIEQTYNCEEQMHLLVLHILEEPKEKVFKFCVCLRKLNGLLADFVQFRLQGDADIDKAVTEEEHTKIKSIVGSYFTADTSKSVFCEDVHILIDGKRKCFTKFDSIRTCIMEMFPDVTFKENDSQFHGVTWTDENNCAKDDSGPGETEENLSNMPSDKFSQYLNLQMERCRTGIGCMFEATTSEECISSDVFVNLTPEQLEEIFSPKLKEVNIKFGYGIKTALSEIQKNIKKDMMRSFFEKNNILRKFDTPPDNTEYTRCTVRPPSGNLLVPVHEFVFPRSKRQMTCAFMGKEAIRFATACINGKKNGTIHFGIKDVGNGNGEIVGLPNEALTLGHDLNLEIRNCIKYCFEQVTASVAERCIRPVQIVPVAGNRIVFEVDVVSFSSHVQKGIIGIMFPPKGNQRKKYFVYRENMIATVEESRLEILQSDIEQLFLERVQLEKDLPVLNTYNHQVSQNRQKLIKLMTGGNRFVTDAFTPVIFCGDISGCSHENDVRRHLSNMDVAFTSSAAVFDFGSSVDLRNTIEKDKYIFQVKVAEDSSTKRFRRESDTFGDKTLWVYSNGNDELGKDKMNIGLWYQKRLNGVKNTLLGLRQQIPNDRGLVIFLVFQKFIERDPMLEIARECFLTTFNGECIIIAESDDVLQDWRNELGSLFTQKELNSKIVTGLKWEDIFPITGNIFRTIKEVTYKLPDSKGSIVELTSDEIERLQLHDIEIVDGCAEDNCRTQEETMSEKEWREHRSEAEKKFYQGNAVTWWNFYYSNHVGKRDAFNLHTDEIKQKLLSKDRENKYEIHTIEHHPGAGGSTLGRYLIWSFSQIKPKHPEEAYRCCIVNKITEATAEEIYRFQTCKESGIASKPVIVLIDNETEDHLNILKPKLDEISYKRGSPGNLFCLLLIVTRVSVSYVSRDIVLKHNLTKNEKAWFEKKFNELETNNNVNVKTLIAFNVMRHSFNTDYIADTTKELMKEVTVRELNLLKCLSLICSFESDHHVPETVFDSLMVGSTFNPKQVKLEDCLGKPFGLVWTSKQRALKQSIDRETWNVNITEALQLLVTHRRVDDAACYNAVCILSQPLAEAVLTYIMNSEKNSFEEIVLNLLDLLRQHMKETNLMSKRFVKLVCSLFKTRQIQEDNKGEAKILKFSDLVLKLERQLPDESIEEAQQRVVKVMSTCFEISNDANIGQQLARFNNHIGDYDAAEKAIVRSLKVFPKNSYFLDTYGQIHKSRMESIIQRNISQKLGDEEGAEFVKFAVYSVRKFTAAQDAAEANDDFTHTNCYNMEVVTALQMLEHFHLFECYIDKDNFWQFLNDPDYNVENSSFNNLLQYSEGLLHFRNGQDLQQHLQRSLTYLEEMAYMTRNHLSSVVTPSKDMLLLRPRERFLRFYGSKEHTLNSEFMYGVGLKLLMKAYESRKHGKILVTRAKDADRRLQQQDPRETERDLLVFLGYNVITLSNRTAQSDSKLYHKLLKYCTQLMELQRKKAKGERRMMEAYLYYALLHWSLPERNAMMENLSHPETYKCLLDEWEQYYFENHKIKRREQLCQRKPKLFFALADGVPGNDIVDLEMLRHRWRAAKLKEGRSRKEVKADDHWRHPIFENCLTRLSGTVDPNGRTVTTKVKYTGKTYEFKVNTIENYSYLSNRVVTFVLGFSWMSLTALDVRREDWKLGRQMSKESTTSKYQEQFDMISSAASSGFQDHEQLNAACGTDETLSGEQGTNRMIIINGNIFYASSLILQERNLSCKSENVGLGNRKNISFAGKHATKGMPKQERKSKGKTQMKSVTRPALQLSATFVSTEEEKSKDSTSKEPLQRQAAMDEESKEEWHEVQSKKKRSRHPATLPHPVYSSTEPEWKKENFKRLVGKLQSEFPHSNRDTIVEAYNEVKKVHGSLDGHDLKFITLEVSRKLKNT